MQNFGDSSETLVKSSISALLPNFDTALDPIVITDANWNDGLKFLYVNDAFCRETLYTKEEIVGKNPNILQGENSDKKVLSDLKRSLQVGKNFIGQSINYKKDGSEYFVRWSISHIKDDTQNTIAYIAFQKILTKYVAIENENTLLHGIVKQSPGMILVTDLEGRIVYANDSFCYHLEYDLSEVVGEHSRMLQSGKQGKNFYKKMWEHLLKEGAYEGVFINKKRDGTIFYDKKRISTIKNEEGDPAYYFSVSYDVTNERRNEQKMLDEIYMDALTHQYNRKKYEVDIARRVDEFYADNESFSIALLDIDHFKKINDTYGHNKGDMVLKELSRLCRAFINNGRDQLYRWGGEEFVILSKTGVEELYELTKVIKEVIREHDFDNLQVTISCGLTQMQKSMDTKEIFGLADKVLYAAKEAGRDTIIVL